MSAPEGGPLTPWRDRFTTEAGNANVPPVLLEFLPVLGIDPGVTTGLAAYSANGWHVGEVFTGDEEGLDRFQSTLSEVQPKTILVERFRPRQGRLAVNVRAQDVTQTARLWRTMVPDPPEFESPLPVQTKNFVSDPVLRANGLWVTGKRNARDAIRLVVFWLVTSHEDWRWKRM